MDVSLPEEILLDETKEGKKSGFYMACGLRVSPNERLLAYCQDTKGNEFYTLKIKDIRSGKHLLRNEIQKAGKQCEWSSDSNVVFYLTVDGMGRPCKVWRHEIEKAAENDVCIYAERTAEFSVSLYKTRDLSTICIACSTFLASSFYILALSFETHDGMSNH